MRIIHISDLHLGRTMNQISLLDDQRYMLLDQVLPLIKSKNADVVLIAGDIFDTFNPTNEAMALYDDFLNAVHSLGTKIIAISGNHDSPMRVEHHQILLEDSGYYVSASFEKEMMKVTLKDEYGPVNFYLLPYFTPEIARRAFPLEDTTGISYDEAVKLAIKQSKINTKERNVIVSHQYVVGANRDPSDTKPLLKANTSDAIGLNAYSQFDYAALGHIHKNYSFRNGTVVYPGSLLPYAIGTSNDRFVSYVELKEKGKIITELLPIYPKRKLITLKGTYDELINSKPDKVNYIEIVLTDEKTSPTISWDFTRLFPNFLGMRREEISNSQKNQGGFSSYDSSKSAIDSICAFYKEKTNTDLDGKSLKLVKSILEECIKDKKA
jgi:exonuclease SbcD